jgi:hypothetical protein
MITVTDTMALLLLRFWYCARRFLRAQGHALFDFSTRARSYPCLYLFFISFSLHLFYNDALSPLTIQ